MHSHSPAPPVAALHQVFMSPSAAYAEGCPSFSVPERKVHPACPWRFLRPIDLTVGQDVREVREVGHRVHVAFRREKDREEADPALEEETPADDGGSHVPPVPVLVLERVAVPCTGHPAAGLDAERRVVTVREGPQRGVTHVDSVAVDVPFRTRACILQVVLPVALAHCSPLVGTRVGGVVVRAAALPAVHFLVVRDEVERLRLGPESVLRIQFHAPDRVDHGAAPVVVDAPVVVREQVGIHDGPLRLVDVGVQRVRRQRPGVSVLRRSRLVELVVERNGPVEFSLVDHHRRSIVAEGHEIVGDELPMLHVVRAPVAVRHRREEVIAVPEDGHDRVGSLAPTLGMVVRERVVYVDRVGHHAGRIDVPSAGRRQQAGGQEKGKQSMHRHGSLCFSPATGQSSVRGSCPWSPGPGATRRPRPPGR